MAAAEPLHEGLHARLMLALAGAGRRAAALDLFVAVRHRLADQLGVGPGPELHAAYLRVLRDDVEPERQHPTPAGDPARPEADWSAPVVPAQLPVDVAGFVGRYEDLNRLDALLANAAERPPAAVVVSAVSGTAGVGKTALAVHWAHRVRDQFPDGQLYVNLRGFDPSGSVMDPADAIRLPRHPRRATATHPGRLGRPSRPVPQPPR